MKHLKTRALTSTIALGAFALLGACGTSTNSTSPSGTGMVTMQLTDAPFLIDSVKSVDVWVVRVDGRIAEADSLEAAQSASDDSVKTGGWTTLATPDQRINLLAFQNGLTFTLGSTNIPAGSYSGFRLVIDPSRSSITLKNGVVLSTTSSPNVSFPSGDRSGLKIVLTQPVTVVTGSTTTVLVDFDVANSFVLRSNSLTTGGLTFKPVIRGSMK